MLFELTRQERNLIANAINVELKVLCANYSKSCDQKRQNIPLFHGICELKRLRDRLISGKSYEQMDNDASDAADASERLMDPDWRASVQGYRRAD